MISFYYFFESIQNFMSRGGWVLYLIFFIIFVLWLLIIERLWYFQFNFKKDAQLVLNKWGKRPFATPQSSSLYFRMWRADLSILSQRLNNNISNIKTLVALCPLLGLLGTVTGMITVFEVMAAVGTGNARLMASGISMATIPTMAGMVGALSGIYISRVLENRVSLLKAGLEKTVTVDEKNQGVFLFRANSEKNNRGL